ncbi:MAG: hypothetical protein LBQ24_07220 [Candidatus Peribacteria bacterium]|nr:hypothetical protein [Candidatus Peribacteria bacterium]
MYSKPTQTKNSSLSTALFITFFTKNSSFFDNFRFFKNSIVLETDKSDNSQIFSQPT